MSGLSGICFLTNKRCDNAHCYHGCIKMLPEADRPNAAPGNKVPEECTKVPDSEIDKDETAWLIEFPGPYYYGNCTGELNVWADEAHALRFARKQDAEMVIADIGWTTATAVEHMWCESRTHQRRPS